MNLLVCTTLSALHYVDRCAVVCSSYAFIDTSTADSRASLHTYIHPKSVDMPCNEETGGSLADLAKHASFGDPYIGGGQFAFTRFTRHHRSL